MPSAFGHYYHLDKIGHHLIRGGMGSGDHNIEQERGSRWWDNQNLVGGLLAVLAVLVRLVYLADSSGDPSFMQPLVDSRTYHDLAAGLAHDGVFTEQFLWQAVFYPFFLAGVYTVFGVSVPAAIIVQVLLGGATCYLTHRLALQMFGRGPALVAGLICALSGPLIFFETRLLATGWTAFLTVTLALILVRADRNPVPRICFALGLTGAVAILTRPTFVPIVIVVLVWLAWVARRRGLPLKGVARSAGAALAGVLLVLGPVAMVLEAKTGHTGIVPPSGGINLFIGNNGDFDSTINIRPGFPWEELLAEPSRNGYAPDPWSGQPYFIDKVMAFGREKPGGQLGLWGRKTLQLISSRELPRTLDIYLHRQWSGILGALVFKLGAWGFPWGVVFPLAVVGLAGSFRKIPVPFLILLGMFGASVVLVFISARYRAPLIPLMAVLAGQGLMSITQGARQGEGVIRTSLLLVFCVLAIALPGSFAQETVDLEPEMYFGVGHNYYRQEDWPAAVENLRKSVALDPWAPAPRNFLGISLVRMGRIEAACAQLDTAVILKPDYGEAVRNLERCRRMEDDPSKATADKP